MTPTLEWSLSDDTLHVFYESDVAKAEVRVPIGEWRIEWSDGHADLLLGGGWRLTWVNGLQAEGSPSCILYLGWDLAPQVWQAITGAPRPSSKDKPAFCPEHASEPLRKAEGRWICVECDKAAGYVAVAS